MCDYQFINDHDTLLHPVKMLVRLPRLRLLSGGARALASAASPPAPPAAHTARRAEFWKRRRDPALEKAARTMKCGLME